MKLTPRDGVNVLEPDDPEETVEFELCLDDAEAMEEAPRIVLTPEEARNR